LVSIIARYTHWLHTRWPAGKPEKLPEVNEDGTTTVPGLRVVGDLTGIPLLKFAVDSGAKAVHRILDEKDFAPGGDDTKVLDIAIVGGGLSGIAAAIEAKKKKLRFEVFEAARSFATIKDFPKGKPIYTYPTDMKTAGDLTLSADVKEKLVEELESQRKKHKIEPRTLRIERVERKGGEFILHHAEGTTRAKRVIVAIGRSGNFRKLGVPGEETDKVFNRLHDPKEFKGKCVLVVGGGDSAMEASIALALAGANVTHSYRKSSFSRPKPDNVKKLKQLQADPNADVAVDQPSSDRVTTSFSRDMCGDAAGQGSVSMAMETNVTEIRDGEVDLKTKDGKKVTIPNDVVFTMIGREPPLDFFRKAGVPIRGEWRAKQYVTFGLFLLFCLWMYHWKKGDWIFGGENPIHHYWAKKGWFPLGVLDWFGNLARDHSSFLYTLKHSMLSPSFYYTLAYCTCVTVFGIKRIKRRRTPYVKQQTMLLIAIQCVPLFILPELLLPYLGRNGFFDEGTRTAQVMDVFFEPTGPSGAQLKEAGLGRAEYWPHPKGQERAYWRAYGLILAWPLFIYNWFTNEPMMGWLLLGGLQTFVLIPLMIRRWGKGSYCGWICSCGALAETMGDQHRHKMPHGPFWNRMNMVGQVILVFATLLMLIRILGWLGLGFANTAFEYLLKKAPLINYAWSVDLMLAGVLGVACYFWFSGRVWCRFACPLAALMHIYTRFSRFRIFAEKEKCISCNVCTSVCHQGIDIMNFANKGRPMEDPECVRCSACVQSCPTGVLYFGRYDKDGKIHADRLPASLIRVEEVGLPSRN